MGDDENVFEKAKGTAKEAGGKLTGSDELAKEGEAQQKRAQKADEAERLEQEAANKRQAEAGHEGEQAKRQ
jgi:uncharacterized protein YjbJ (UPF0337 family)